MSINSTIIHLFKTVLDNLCDRPAIYLCFKCHL